MQMFGGNFLHVGQVRTRSDRRGDSGMKLDCVKRVARLSGRASPAASLIPSNDVPVPADDQEVSKDEGGDRLSPRGLQPGLY